MEKSQTRCKAGTESHGSFETAGLPTIDDEELFMASFFDVHTDFIRHRPDFWSFIMKNVRLFLMLLFSILLFTTEAWAGWGSSNNPTISISPASVSKTEGDSGTVNVTLTISASECPNKKDIKIHWQTNDGSATSGSDFTSASGDITFDVPGWLSSCDKDQDITVQIKSDTDVEPDEDFTVTIEDGGTNASQKYTWGDQTSTITIENDDSAPVNHAPSASDDTASTDENTSVTINVLSNDTDADGDTLSVTGTSNGPSHGSATVNADGTITYTPDNGYTGTDTFDYSISDGNSGTDSAMVTVTVNAPSTTPVSATPPVCIESLTYSKGGGALDSCFNSGIFVGGSGCKQIIKLRNLSSHSVTDTNISMNYGTSGNRCGVDGVDKTGSECNVATNETIFDPLGDFSALQAHTIYVEGAGASIGNTNPDIYMTFTEDGTQKYGKVDKCVIEDAYSAEDMCIADTQTITHGTAICIDIGDFFSIALSPPPGIPLKGSCEKQITLRNISDENLTDVSTQLITDSLFNGSMFDDCGVDGISRKSSGECTDSNMMDAGFMSMGGLFQGRSVTYDPVPDFAPDDEHSTYTDTKLSGSFLNSSTYVGTYIKKDENGVLHLYSGELKKCDEITDQVFEVNTSVDAVDKYETDGYDAGKGLKTRVAKKTYSPDTSSDANLYSLDVIYLGNSDPAAPMTYNAANMTVFIYLLDDECNNPVKLKDTDGKWLMAVIEKGEITGSTPAFKLDKISRKARIGMRYIDFNKLILEGGPTCLQNSSTGGNAVPGMPQCVASDHQYKLAFGEEAYQRCKVNNGEPCKPNHHGVGDAPYDHAYGCYECTMGSMPGSCSSDNFAIRPDKFDISTSSADFPELLRSGKDYNLSLTAKDDDDSVSGDYNITSYNWTNDLDGNATKYFKDGTIDTSGLLFGDVDINTSVTAYSVAGKSSFTATEPANAQEVIPVSYDDVGLITLIVYDKNWAAVDNDDTPMDCNDSHAHTYICGEKNATFIPDHFELKEVNVTNRRKDQNLTYLSSDLNMSAHVELTIKAVNAKGDVTKNFRKGSKYYENPLEVNITVPYTVTFPDGTERNMTVIDKNVSSALLGFGGSDANGTHTIAWDDSNKTQRLLFNYKREYNTPINPFEVNGTIIDVNVTSVYTSSSGTVATITGGDNADKNATFVYARAKATKDIYDDVTDNVIFTPIKVEVYCNQWPISAQNCPSVDVINGQTNDYKWFISTDHSTQDNDGNITLKSDIGTVSSTVNITNNGIDKNIEVMPPETLPATVNITFDTGTNSWLVYNPNSDILDPNPFYQVNFVGTMDWAGYGQTGNVLDSNSSTKKNKRLGW